MERYFILIMVVISFAAIATGKDRAHYRHILKPYTKINTSVGEGRGKPASYDWLRPLPLANPYFTQ